MNAPTARDGYARYYTEKLWALVPEVYRNEDTSGVYRQLIALIATDAVDVRRSIDRLWEDQHIETCDDWAVPYIGALVGTRLVSAQDRRARRADVGNTVRFRRRRGTPALLDTLARALSGWDVVLEEGFRQLARNRHRLDGPGSLGFFTQTPTGGTADLRRPVGAEIANGPFGEFFHTLDARRLQGDTGRFGVRKLNFHIYRMRAFEMIDVDPVQLGDPLGEGNLRTYTFDPSGRDLALYLGGDSGSADEKDAFLRGNLVSVEPREWQILQPMRCRLLGHVSYDITASAILSLEGLAVPPLPSDLVALNSLIGHQFDSEQALRRRLTDRGAAIGTTPPDWYIELLAMALVEETGKAQLYPMAVEVSAGGAPFPTERISAGNLADPRRHPIPAGEVAQLLIYPEAGYFASVPPDEPFDFVPLASRYYYGFSAEIGAGPYPRPTLEQLPTNTAADGIAPNGGAMQDDGLLITDNRSYDLTFSSGTPLSSPSVLTVGPQRRPFVRVAGDTLTTPTLQPADIDSVLIIDGGWYAAQDPDGDLAAGEPVDFTLEGAAAAGAGDFDFDQVTISFATLDPGGTRADGTVIPALRLRVAARIRRLLVQSAITGPIVVEDAGADDPSVIDELVVCQSIVDASQTSSGVAISNPFGRLILEGATVFGDLEAMRLDATNSLVRGVIRVVNNQAGCFRFSATLDAPNRRLPPRYRSIIGPIPAGYFNSRRFGDAHYAQLSPLALPLTTAAENGSEVGAFSHLITPIRLASIRAKVNEFGPVGQLAQYLFADDPVLDAPFEADPVFVTPGHNAARPARSG
ncbi:hypothetical protein ACERZ8_09580 [Tateyamaria armeniaca]|uniref:Baseplate protein J-like domain-containing protein n=1 Tax=Tateyamaria armeniaca TaxID=2518930 RepID=A0ABW8UTA1_9RHOB